MLATAPSPRGISALVASPSVQPICCSKRTASATTTSTKLEAYTAAAWYSTRSSSPTCFGLAPIDRATARSCRIKLGVVASTAIVIPRKADGSRAMGNDCSGWNDPRGLPSSALNASSPSAPLTCTMASAAGGFRRAIRAAISFTAPSGTARNSRPWRGKRKPVRAGTRRACMARARLRPRLPRPATVIRSGVLARGGAGRRLPRLLLRKDLVQLLAVDRLDDLEPLHHSVHLRPRLAQHALGGLVAVVDDAADLLVDDGGDLFRVGALFAQVAAEEHELFAMAHLDGAELFRHAPLRDHAAGDLGRLLDVVLGAGRDVAQDDLLRDASAHDARDLVHQPVARDEVLVLLGQAQRPAERHAAGDDRDLVHRVGVRQPLHDQRVPGLVVGDDLFLFFRDAPALALRAGDDAGDRLFELVHADDFLVRPSGEDGGLVDEVRQVGSAEAGGLARQHVEVDCRVERLVAGVHVEDRPATLDVRPVQRDVTVEAAGPEESRVQDVRPVGGRDHD